MRQLPPLSAVRAFEAIARSGSVTRAAEELCRSHGAISRHLRLLQEHAGVALFEKDGTGLRLTQAGATFYAAVRAAFDQLENAYERLARESQAPGLHVACSATFAMRWLVPQLAVFYRKHPEIRIRLSMTSAREMRNEGADLILAWDLSGYAEADLRRALALAPVRAGSWPRAPALRMNTPPAPGTNGRPSPASRQRWATHWRSRTPTCASKRRSRAWEWPWSSGA